MAFVKFSEYQAPFNAERSALLKERKSHILNKPKDLEKFTPPYDNSWGIGAAIIAALIALAVNVVLSLILAAVLDSVYPNYDTMPQEQKDTIFGLIWLSMLVLPIIVIIVCIIHDIKAASILKKFEKVKKTPEYQAALSKMKEYDAKDRLLNSRIDELNRKMNSCFAWGVIYVDGGAPSGTSYMGTLCVDGEENKAVINYDNSTYEFYITNGKHKVIIKSGEKILWHELFSFNGDSVVTIDIA
ncbi:MAG: hypothetical protein IJX55_09035, partial [Clostridia bacterium]|nr:hypothetical protein [Clostridia bacterium]